MWASVQQNVYALVKAVCEKTDEIVLIWKVYENWGSGTKISIVTKNSKISWRSTQILIPQHKVIR